MLGGRPSSWLSDQDHQGPGLGKASEFNEEISNTMYKYDCSWSLTEKIKRCMSEELAAASLRGAVERFQMSERGGVLPSSHVFSSDFQIMRQENYSDYTSVITILSRLIKTCLQRLLLSFELSERLRVCTYSSQQDDFLD